jgi:hypothetical protein
MLSILPLAQLLATGLLYGRMASNLVFRGSTMKPNGMPYDVVHNPSPLTLHNPFAFQQILPPDARSHGH